MKFKVGDIVVIDPEKTSLIRNYGHFFPTKIKGIKVFDDTVYVVGDQDSWSTHYLRLATPEEAEYYNFPNKLGELLK